MGGPARHLRNSFGDFRMSWPEAFSNVGVALALAVMMWVALR